MKTTRDISAALGLALVMFLVIRTGCEWTGNDGDQFIQDSTFTTYDSTEVAMDPVEPISPDTIWRDSLVYLTTPIDSEAVALAYFERRTYRQTFRDSSLHLDLEIDLFKNTITGIRPIYKLLKPTTVSHFSARPQSSISGGLQLGPLFAGPRLEYRIRDKWTLGASYNLAGGPTRWTASATITLFDW